MSQMEAAIAASKRKHEIDRSAAMDKVIAAIEAGASIQAAASAGGVWHPAVREWRKKYPHFRERFEKAIERSNHNRAVDLLTTSELCKRLGITVLRFRKLINRGTWELQPKVKRNHRGEHLWSLSEALATLPPSLKSNRILPLHVTRHGVSYVLVTTKRGRAVRRPDGSYGLSRSLPEGRTITTWHVKGCIYLDPRSDGSIRKLSGFWETGIVGNVSRPRDYFYAEEEQLGLAIDRMKGAPSLPDPNEVTLPAAVKKAGVPEAALRSMIRHGKQYGVVTAISSSPRGLGKFKRRIQTVSLNLVTDLEPLTKIPQNAAILPYTAFLLEALSQAGERTR